MTRKRFSLLLLVFAMSLPSLLLAEEAASEWRPPADGFDWIQLKHKEWLMGEIKSMYNDNLEFDSDNLDIQSINWADITYLRSAGETSIKIEHLAEVIGIKWSL